MPILSMSLNKTAQNGRKGIQVLGGFALVILLQHCRHIEAGFESIRAERIQRSRILSPSFSHLARSFVSPRGKGNKYQYPYRLPATSKLSFSTFHMFRPFLSVFSQMIPRCHAEVVIPNAERTLPVA